MSWNPLDDLSAAQREQLDAFAHELTRVNRRINLVSPATIPHLEERHLAHSLTLAYRSFPNGCRVVDFGSGGGFPAVPLAIRFPEVEFIAVDAVGKKTEAVKLFARRLALSNLTAWNGRADTWDGSAHYAVSRATAPLTELWTWFSRAREPLDSVPETCWPPGLLALKGGDLSEEEATLNRAFARLALHQVSLESLLNRPYFRDKVLVAVAPEE